MDKRHGFRLKQFDSSSFVLDEVTDTTATSDAVVHRIIQEESRMKGTVSLRVYWRYCVSAGGITFVLLLFFGYSIVQTLLFGNDMWIKVWADAFARRQNGEEVDIAYYALVYAMMGLSVVVALFLRVLIVSIGSIRASRTLHQQLRGLTHIM